MEVIFEVPMSFPPSHACRRLLECLEAQHFLYKIVRGIRDKEYREIHVLVSNPVVFNISISKANGEGGVLSWLSVFDLKEEFVDEGKIFPIVPDIARQHVCGLLWRFLSRDKTFPWIFQREEKKGFLFFAKKERVVGDFHKAKRKWEQFLGEEIR
jgi:hypothetical protein